jgi:hypothetical protein
MPEGRLAAILVIDSFGYSVTTGKNPAAWG